MTFKRVSSAVAGDATHFGGLDVNKFSDYLGGTDIGGSETVTINTATTFNSGKATLTNPVFSLTSGVNMRSTATGPQGFEFGPNEITGGASFMDWHTNSGDGDYRLRLIRNSGADGTFDITQTGRGGIRILQDSIALDSTWAEVLYLRGIVQSTPAVADDWATVKVETIYRADDVSDPFDLTVQGFKCVLVYGEPGIPAVGTAQTRTTNAVVQQSSNSSSEIAIDMAWMRADNGSTGSFWFTDWTLQGGIGVQPGLLSGVTMLVNNYYNGNVIRGSGRSYCFAALTLQGSGAAIDGTTHESSPTYKVNYGFGVHGFAADAGRTNIRRGFEYGVLIGDRGGSWITASDPASKIGTGIQINDVEDAGIEIKDPAVTTASSTVKGITFTNATRTYDIGIDLSGGTFTAFKAIKLANNQNLLLGANYLNQGSWRNTGAGPMGIEFGPDDATGGAVYQDWHVSNVDGDYSARLIRNTGANGTWDFINTGTGHIKFQANGIELTGYAHFAKITAPTDPSVETARLYLKTTDASNNGLFVKLKKGSVIVESQIAPLDNERVGKHTAASGASIYNIAHGLGSNPTYAFINCSSHLTTFTYTTDSTNIVVTFSSTISSGTVTIYWRVVA